MCPLNPKATKAPKNRVFFPPLSHACGRLPPRSRRRGGRRLPSPPSPWRLWGGAVIRSRVLALPIPVCVLVATTAVMPTTRGRPSALRLAACRQIYRIPVNLQAWRTKMHFCKKVSSDARLSGGALGTSTWSPTLITNNESDHVVFSIYMGGSSMWTTEDDATCARIALRMLTQHKCRDPGSKPGPSDLQSDAFPTELSRLRERYKKFLAGRQID